MANKNIYESSPEAIQAHLGILQGIIQRMSANSASSKAWCITLVSAILVFVADKGKPQYILIAIIPTILFFVLDAYYLALEIRFRNSYNEFIEKLHNSKVVTSDLYAVLPKGNQLKIFFVALFSFSVWPFYLTLLGLIWITKEIVIANP